MISSKVWFGAVLCGFLIANASAHTYKSGECPSVEPMSGFDMKKVSREFCSTSSKILSEEAFNLKCVSFYYYSNDSTLNDVIIKLSCLLFFKLLFIKDSLFNGINSMEYLISKL